MAIHFLTLELALAPAPNLQRSILAELHHYGEPLRWAIVAINAEANKVQIEAVVTTKTEFLIPAAAVTTV
jgi:hypothetical protein